MGEWVGERGLHLTLCRCGTESGSSGHAVRARVRTRVRVTPALPSFMCAFIRTCHDPHPPNVSLLAGTHQDPYPNPHPNPHPNPYPQLDPFPGRCSAWEMCCMVFVVQLVAPYRHGTTRLTSEVCPSSTSTSAPGCRPSRGLIAANRRVLTAPTLARPTASTPGLPSCPLGSALATRGLCTAYSGRLNPWSH